MVDRRRANMRFATPWVLVLLPILPLILLAATSGFNNLKFASMRYSSISHTQTPNSSWKLKLSPILIFLRLISVGLLIIAAARPQIVNARTVITGEGVDIVLALDISGSMANTDMKLRSRLNTAKTVISDFISAREHDRIGLVVFARESFIQSPPTTDHEVLKKLLVDLEPAPELLIDDGTAIGLGLASAANMLKNSPNNSKLVILLTDGMNNSGQLDPITAAAAAKALEIKIHTIGLGQTTTSLTGSGIPSLYMNLLGNTIDETTMEEIADTTGGLYFQASDPDGLKAIYQEINRLETSEIEERFFIQYKELMAYLTIPGVVFLLIEFLSKNTFLRKIP